MMQTKKIHELIDGHRYLVTRGQGGIRKGMRVWYYAEKTAIWNNAAYIKTDTGIYRDAKFCPDAEFELDLEWYIKQVPQQFKRCATCEYWRNWLEHCAGHDKPALRDGWCSAWRPAEWAMP